MPERVGQREKLALQSKDFFFPRLIEIVSIYIQRWTVNYLANNV